MNHVIRIAAIIEAATVTGPAKNLIRLCRLARNPPPGETALDISIVTFQRGAGAATPANAFIETVRAADIELDVIPEGHAFDRSIVAQLGKALSRRNPGIVQTHGVKSHFLIRVARLDAAYPWLAFHHGYTAEDLKMRAYNQLDRWSLRTARRVVTVCGPFAQEMENIGVARSKIEILPNSIESAPPASLEQVDEMRSRLGIRAAERVLLSIGRFSREKGHIDLVAMAAEIARQRPGLCFRVVLAGDGPERQRVEEAVASMGDRFVFTGHLNDVKPLYGLADVFVLPSYSEGSPNVLLESMAARVPIVATDVGGVPETVLHEVSALLVRPLEPKALATQIVRVLDDPVLASRLRDHAEAEVKRRSPDAYRRSLSRIYSGISAK